MVCSAIRMPGAELFLWRARGHQASEQVQHNIGRKWANADAPLAHRAGAGAGRQARRRRFHLDLVSGWAGNRLVDEVFAPVASPPNPGLTRQREGKLVNHPHEDLRSTWENRS